ncbi:MAG: hypothetical protein M3Z00_13450 [Actinomycetota bacterium]|nr:hypothetical protein [Actinomycetota bacterium]
MDKILKIAGIILVAWVALGLVGWVFHFLISTVFWVGLIAGGVWLVSSIKGRSRTAVNGRRSYPKIG